MLNLENSLHPAINELMKHWLLDIAFEFPRNLSLLFPVVEKEALNVKQIYGPQPGDYARALIDLFGAGMIRFSSEVPGDDVQSLTGMSTILERFLGLLKDDSLLRRGGRILKPYQRHQVSEIQVFFELTALGGQAWERVAEPDWANFFTQSTDDTTGELVSQNLNLLMARMGWFRELNEQRIQLDTIRLQTHLNYQVLYWKRLPLVHQVLFSVEPAEPRWADGRRREPVWFREWWSSANSWYRKPWELPIWPSE